LGTTLKHSFQPNGKGAAATESLSQPDDIVALGGNLYVGFQNGVGSQGEASTSGNLDSTLAEFTPSGSVVKQWDVTGKIDGMGADAATGQVFATVNEDSKSSLYTVSGGTVTHYTYATSAEAEVLKISNSVDDIAWATSATGTLYTSDASSNTVDAITGTFTPGTAYTAVTPCNANSAPSTCPAPGYPANTLGTIDLTTGKVGTVATNGLVTPKGMIFVP